MATIKLTVQHGTTLIELPVEEGIQLEYERTGSPGKLTFTTVNTPGMTFFEGDPVCFYYDGKLKFLGYVFTKKCDREHNIEVTCYDQIRYLKNKYTYLFEKKTATQIIKALCADLGLSVGAMDNTSYVIPTIAEENKSALDIILEVLEETLVNTGNRFVFYDDAGKLRVRNCADMVSSTLIMESTAENFDYSSSIDDETYNQVVLYYKNNDGGIAVYQAHSPSTVKQWGNLRYFEEVKNSAIAQNKANSLLKLYNKKTRELKIKSAFGDISVRGGTLIPVRLDLGDVTVNNFMLVEKVTHKFDKDYHTMDLTLEGSWGDSTTDTVSSTSKYKVTVELIGSANYAGYVSLKEYSGGRWVTINNGKAKTLTEYVEAGTKIKLTIDPGLVPNATVQTDLNAYEYVATTWSGSWVQESDGSFTSTVYKNHGITVRWTNQRKTKSTDGGRSGSF